jgi:ferredoxin
VKVVVDRTVCSSYGVCIETVPDVFSFDDQNELIIAASVPQELEAKVRFACESCPTQALRIEE